MTDFGNQKKQRRERVFQMLYSLDFDKEKTADECFRSFFDEDDEIPDSGYIHDVFCGVAEFSSEADAMIEKDSKNWSTGRMSGVTRNVLRLAIYELLNTDVPPKVAISEAVEIAKQYGDGQEPSFVNGILNRIAKENGKI